MAFMGKRVLILHTGGTLGMRPTDPHQTLAPDEFGPTVLEQVPELTEIAEIETRMMFNVDSSDIREKHWVALANEIVRSAPTCDGVVITHGTDAMSYTASALSFLLRGLDRPVILTGSQRPLADARTDGRANLAVAVDLALRDIPEVAIYFDGLLLRGNRTTKSSTFAFGAFASPNYLPLAEVGTYVRRVRMSLPSKGPLRVEGRFDSRVSSIRLVPGQDAAVFRGMASAGIKGLLLVAFGAGNLPVEDRSVAEAVRELVDAGIVVAIGSQSPNGRVNLDRYLGGRLAREMGAIGTGDMTIEAATVKLMYLLGTLDSADAVREALTVPIAGEVRSSMEIW